MKYSSCSAEKTDTTLNFDCQSYHEVIIPVQYYAPYLTYRLVPEPFVAKKAILKVLVWYFRVCNFLENH